MLVKVAEDIWVNPVNIDCIEYDSLRVSSEGARVMIRFQGGGGKLLPRDITVQDVVDRLSYSSP